MQQLLRENRVYFILFGLFLVIAGGLLATINQGDAILFFNSQRVTWADVFFAYGTKLGEEVAYAGLVIVFLVFDWKKALLLPILGVFITFVSYFTKALFAQDRPATYFKKLDLLQDISFIEGIDMHTGASSFPSGHTMSAFALYTLVALLSPKKWWIQIGLFGLALLVGLSRIYLVQHFLRDVYAGSIMGVGIGVLFYFAYQVLLQRGRKKQA